MIIIIIINGRWFTAVCVCGVGAGGGTGLCGTHGPSNGA